MPISTSTSKAPRVLYLPNEGDFVPAHGQVGGRAAFTEMLEQGVIGDLKIYSYLADYFAKSRKKEAAHRELLDVVRAFQPDIIFWQHPNEYPVPATLIEQIRACGSSPLIAYHEGDPFDRWYKLMAPEVVTLYRHCDVFFTIGLGYARRAFSKLRQHPHFYYSPSIFDRERIGLEPPSLDTIGSKYDAIMIGTIGTRIRGMYRQPHSGKRIRLARAMTKAFGDRFAVFGAGWPSGTNNLGKIQYGDQARTIQTAKMSMMWDVYPEYTYYFSDRLPIALASGIPFITNRRFGFEAMFANVPGFYQVDAIEGAVDTAMYLRSLPIEQIAALGLAARKFAFENFEARLVYRRAVDICLEVWRGER
jgi:hypothetical protein